MSRVSCAICLKFTLLCHMGNGNFFLLATQDKTLRVILTLLFLSQLISCPSVNIVALILQTLITSLHLPTASLVGSIIFSCLDFCRGRVSHTGALIPPPLPFCLLMTQQPLKTKSSFHLCLEPSYSSYSTGGKATSLQWTMRTSPPTSPCLSDFSSHHSLLVHSTPATMPFLPILQHPAMPLMDFALIVPSTWSILHHPPERLPYILQAFTQIFPC